MSYAEDLLNALKKRTSLTQSEDSASSLLSALQKRIRDTDSAGKRELGPVKTSDLVKRAAGDKVLLPSNDITKKILGTGIDDESLLSSFTLDEFRTARDEATDRGDRVRLNSLFNQKLIGNNRDILSNTKMDGTDRSVLDEMNLLAKMESSDEKEERKTAVLKKMEELGLNTDDYALYAGDSNFTWGNFGNWLGSAAMSGLASANKGFTSTANLILGSPLKALGWENNPISELADYYSGVYDAYKYDTDLYAQKLGGGEGYEFAGSVIEGTMGAVPNAILAVMTAGASLGGTAATTSSSLATKAAYEAGSVLTKTGLTTEAMLKNPQYWLSFGRTYGTDYEEAKAMGADDTTAVLGATLTSLVNAGIEIGTDGLSGIQGLPQKVAEEGGSKLLKWTISNFSEGGEEGLQKFVNEAVAKVLYDHELDILDPREYVKEMAIGTLSGAALGGGQIGLQGASNAIGNTVQNYAAAGSGQIVSDQGRGELTVKPQGVDARPEPFSESEYSSETKPTLNSTSNNAVDDAGIKTQIRSSQNELNAMPSVADIQVTAEFSQLDKAGKQNWVIEKLRSTGYKVERKGFGVINFAKKQLSKAFKYFKKGGAEEAAFEALPYVLQNGMEISSHENHKGRDYGTVTIAAPITINGKRGNMAVVVKQTTDNYYKVHRILTPDGSVFVLPEMTNEAESTIAGESPKNGSLATPKDSASNDIISQTAENVNTSAVSVNAQPGRVLTKNEQAVVDKVYKDAVAEAEKDGKVSQKRKAEIYEQVLEEMDRGEISTETIEEVLGGLTAAGQRQTVKDGIADIITRRQAASTSAVDTAQNTDYDNTKANTGGAIYAGQRQVDNRGIQRNSQIDPQGEVAGSTTNGSRNADAGAQIRDAGGSDQGTVYTKDSEGRGITSDVSVRIQGTSVADQNGVPIAVYHSTDNMEFDTFAKGDTGFHFGTQSQAQKRSKDKGFSRGRIFRAYLNIRNPIRARYDIMGWTPRGTALHLWSEGVLSDQEHNEIVSLWQKGDGYDSASAVRLREILENKGYDGIVYANSFEGDGDSYIAFHDDQIIRSEIINFPADSQAVNPTSADGVNAQAGRVLTKNEQAYPDDLAPIGEHVRRYVALEELGPVREDILMPYAADPDDLAPIGEHVRMEAAEFAQEYGKAAEKVAERFKNDFTLQANSDTMKAINGARITNINGLAAEKHAERYYGLVRSMTTDVAKIAENTGYSESVIQRIKNFIFLDKHDLGDLEPRRFDPSFAMAQSWQRLINGTPEPHDIVMLQHEIFEQELMERGLSQHQAHIEASKKYNYAKESDDYYAALKERKNRK